TETARRISALRNANETPTARASMLVATDIASIVLRSNDFPGFGKDRFPGFMPYEVACLGSNGFPGFGPEVLIGPGPYRLSFPASHALLQHLLLDSLIMLSPISESNANT